MVRMQTSIRMIVCLLKNESLDVKKGRALNYKISKSAALNLIRWIALALSNFRPSC
jgi:hypothetical protein